MNYPELEIGLSRCDAASYAVQVRFRDPDQEAELGQASIPLPFDTVQVRFRDPDQEAEQRVDVKDPVRFDFEQLRELAVDPAAYGRLLGQNLFGHPDVRSAWSTAWPSARTGSGSSVAAAIRVSLRYGTRRRAQTRNP
jgi:hypothetical protein